MRIGMKARQELTAATAGQYQRSRKKDKTVILDQFIAATGYSRCQARYLLRNHGRRVVFNERTVMVGDVRTRGSRKRAHTYDEKVLKPLLQIWRIFDYICGKRLVAILGEMAELLVRQGELKCDAETLGKLKRMSAATIDRMLRPERRKHTLRGRSQTKPGSLLKHQIPIRTFADWDDVRPGFVEIDLVGHEGGMAAGDFCQTLDLTDIATTWTETRAVPNKAQVNVFAALKILRKNLPFPLLGIDSDSGAEFINQELLRYCQKEKITFTRSRPNRKNDNCYIEQKNYSIVRRAVGYARYDTPEQLALLNELYRHYRLYTNFFLPTMKLLSKERVGSKITKRYDTPQTPYRRVLASTDVSKEDKQRLEDQFPRLNPAALKRKIDRLQRQLSQTVSLLKRSPATARKLAGIAKRRSPGLPTQL